jgi:hypothetical protein
MRVEQHDDGAPPTKGEEASEESGPIGRDQADGHLGGRKAGEGAFCPAGQRVEPADDDGALSWRDEEGGRGGATGQSRKRRDDRVRHCLGHWLKPSACASILRQLFQRLRPPSELSGGSSEYRSTFRKVEARGVKR